MYKLSFCDPFVPALLELGDYPPEKVLDKFEEIRWRDHLGLDRQSNVLREYFSPSFCVEHISLNRRIEFWAVDNDRDHEWVIFYKRPEIIRTWFGLRRHYREEHISNAIVQSREDVIRCLKAFIRNDFDFLNRKVR